MDVFAYRCLAPNVLANVLLVEDAQVSKYDFIMDLRHPFQHKYVMLLI